VYYHDDAGRLRMMPITWTSLIAEDPTLVVGAGRSPFRLADLLELSRWIEQFRQPDPRPDQEHHQPPNPTEV
jgi:hypothetical protein